MGEFLRSPIGWIVFLIIVAFVLKPVRNFLVGAAVHQANVDTATILRTSADALKKNPADYDALMKRGDAYITMFQANLAVGDFTAAIALRPKSADAYLKRAAAYEALGEQALAQKDRDTANSLGH